MLLEALPLLKTKTCSIALACICAGALAGCDTGEVEQAQGEADGSFAQETEIASGLVVRDFVGQTISEAVVTDPAGITLALSETGGKPVLLNLWATWCAPCIVEMPMLNQIAGEMQEDLRVITVSADLESSSVVTFFEENELQNLPRWLDTDFTLTESFGGGPVLPLTILYDAQGNEIWRVVGAYEWTQAEGRALIAEAFETAE